MLEPATWVTDARPADAALTLLAGWGGGGSYDHTEVIESDREVRIAVLIRHRVPADPVSPHARTLELRTGTVEVHLAAPLGDRALVGVAAPDDPLGSGLRSRGRMPADVPPLEIVTR